MSEEIKEAFSAVKELRSTMETVADAQKSFEAKFDKLDGLDKEKVEKINTALDEHEKKNQELVIELKKSEKEALELKERLEGLEKTIIFESKKLDVNLKELPEYKAFNELVKKGSMSDVSMEHKNYLRTDVGQFGGFLVPEMMASDLLKEVTEISNVRALSRVRTTQTKTLNIPVKTTNPTSFFEGEGESTEKSTSKYKSETMTAHRQHVVVPVTRDQLNFSSFDMESEITSDVVTAFAQGEGNKFVTGTGVKQPLGFLDSGSGITTIDSASTGVVTMDDVIKLSGELKVGYNPVYAFNLKTLTSLRTEKDSNGNYLWRIGGETQPTTINGFNYVILQDMPDIANSSLSIVFGDFFRGYNILDALQMELVRDDVTRKEAAIVEFSWNRYLDGRVVLAEAFKILKTKA